MQAKRSYRDEAAPRNIATNMWLEVAESYELKNARRSLGADLTTLEYSFPESITEKLGYCLSMACPEDFADIMDRHLDAEIIFLIKLSKQGGLSPFAYQSATGISRLSQEKRFEYYGSFDVVGVNERIASKAGYESTWKWFSAFLGGLDADKRRIMLSHSKGWKKVSRDSDQRSWFVDHCPELLAEL